MARKIVWKRKVAQNQTNRVLEFVLLKTVKKPMESATKTNKTNKTRK